MVSTPAVMWTASLGVDGVVDVGAGGSNGVDAGDGVDGLHRR